MVFLEDYFHFGTSPRMTKHHLPYQVRNWMKNFNENIKNGRGSEDLKNFILTLYGTGVASFGMYKTAKTACECE